jgi:hypothetical protein
MPSSIRRILDALSAFHRIGFGLLLAFTLQAAWAQAPGQAPGGMDRTLNAMLDALQSGSLPDFIAPGDAAFQSGMNQQMLEQVRTKLAPRLKQGYTSTFLGTLHQEGYTIYLWKLGFKDGLDDRLITMAVKEGKVAGFFLR